MFVLFSFPFVVPLLLTLSEWSLHPNYRKKKRKENEKKRREEKIKRKLYFFFSCLVEKKTGRKENRMIDK